mmetsp:Transcript_44694/g.96092  ORF Transcript_44694/g.96092 Transcript_44694/m.96092 type:complete len:83 (-) Transcript_44694:448-696(-)
MEDKEEGKTVQQAIEMDGGASLPVEIGKGQKGSHDDQQRYWQFSLASSALGRALGRTNLPQDTVYFRDDTQLPLFQPGPTLD